MTVAGALPAVAGDLEGAADATGGNDDGGRAQDHESPVLAFVAEGAGDAVAVIQQRRHGALHVDRHTERHDAVLQRADHLESGPVADVSEPRVTMAAEVAL